MTTTDLDQVIANLSDEEKAAIVQGADMWHTQGVPSAGIEPIMVSDGPHGLRAQPNGAGDHGGLLDAEEATCFPTASNIHAAWDRDLATRVGEAIAAEAKALGVSVVLGPGMNIKRSPLCGRNFEYISEDPYLTGQQAAAYIKGVQGQGVGVSPKHFAVNNQETERVRVDAQVDERTMREIYFPAFEHVVRTTQPWTIMCSYNWLNGTRVANHPWLLTDVLRKEWGFEGLVVSDWGAVFDRAQSVAAGLDLEMPPTGERANSSVLDALADGSLSREDLDASVRRVLELNLKGAGARVATGDIPWDEHHALAREAAAQGCVLLKNDGVLPLAPEAKLAVIGEFARTPRFQGGGSSNVTVRRTDKALDELVAIHGEVPFAEGYSLTDPEANLADEAVALAKDADVVLFFAGLTDVEESEGYDRSHMELPPQQIAAIKAVCAANPRTVVVLSNGSAVRLNGWDDQPAAILEAWLGGQAAGGAIVDVLTGKVNPAGRLCETLPLRLEDNPSFGNFPGEDLVVRYGEGVLVGYRGYDHKRMDVSYPFGFGLSYTTFEYTNLEVTQSGSVATDDLTVQVTASVTNTGDRAGAEVVQLYVGDPEASVLRPVRELKGYAKVFLAPGESTEVTLDLDQRAFAFWSTQVSDWVVEAGDFVISVGRNSRDLPLSQVVTVDAPSRRKPLDINSTAQEWVADELGRQVLIDLHGEDGQLPGIYGSDEFMALIGNFPAERVTNFPFGKPNHAELLEALAEYGRRRQA